MIVLTIDVDWAPDEITLEVLKKVDALGVKCSIFFTGGKLFKEKFKNIEFGVHPELLNKNALEIDKTLKDFNNLSGSNLIRTHRFFWYSDLAKIMLKNNFLYDSSLILPYQKNIKIFKTGKLTRFPVWASDHLHLVRGYSFKNLQQMPNWQESKLKIFCFHIAYLYLNQKNLCDFNMIDDNLNKNAKPNKNDFGIWNFFELLAEEIHKKSTGCFLKELV